MLEPGEGNSHSRLGLCGPRGHVLPLCAEPPCSPGSKRQQSHSVEASGYAQGFLSPVYSLPTWLSWPAILQSRNSQGGGCAGSAVLVHKAWPPRLWSLQWTFSEISKELCAPLGKESHSEQTSVKVSWMQMFLGPNGKPMRGRTSEGLRGPFFISL